MRLEMEKWAMRRTRRERFVVTIPRANYLAKNITVGCCLSVPGVESSFAVWRLRVFPPKWWLHLISACLSPDRRGAAHAT